MPGAQATRTRIHAVCYLNSLPMVWGLRQFERELACDLQLSAPAGCLEAYRAGEAEVTLVPCGGLTLADIPLIVSHYCIGAIGPVDTVCLFSNSPAERIKRVLLDPHSRTSVRLLMLLGREYWQTEWEYGALNLSTLSTLSLNNDEGVLLIGDKVFAQRARWRFCYDLSETWRLFTNGLPFVFAVWLRQHDFHNVEWIARMDNALAHGVNHRYEALAEHELPPGVTRKQAENYLTSRIDYALDTQKREGLVRFLTLCEKHDLLGDNPTANALGK